MEIAKDLKKRFPEGEGWKVTLTYWSVTGYEQKVKE